MREETRVFLNTWGAYNNNSIGYGWMTPQEALDFMEDNPEKDGGEFFIADIDNYLGVDFGNLDYANVENVCNQILELESLDDDRLDVVIAIMNYDSYYSVEDAIRKADDVIVYGGCYTMLDVAYNVVEEMGILNDVPENIARYFDYEAYARDIEIEGNFTTLSSGEYIEIL